MCFSVSCILIARCSAYLSSQFEASKLHFYIETRGIEKLWPVSEAASLGKSCFQPPQLQDFNLFAQKQILPLVL